MKEIKVIIAGGRDFSDISAVKKALCSDIPLLDDYISSVISAGESYKITIVSGMARGADKAGYEAAKELHLKCYEFPADWNKYGKSAGFRRNAEMAQFADVLIAFWDGESRGTKHMIETMQRLNKPVHIVRY